MFCARCGKIITPSMPVINGNCPDWTCVKVPKVLVKPKMMVDKQTKPLSKPVKIVLETLKDIPVPMLAIRTNRLHKVIKVRDIKREMESRFVRPWK